MITADPLLTAALAIYFLVSPPVLALIVVQVARRSRDLAGGDPRDIRRRFSRWLGLPWILYLMNVLAGGVYLGTTETGMPAGDMRRLAAVIPVLVIALVPILLIARITRSWERSLGHPGGKVALRVEVRAWLGYVGFLALGIGAALAAISLWGPAVGIAVACLGIGAYLVAYPDLFRWIWQARPLADDEWRRRIHALTTGDSVPFQRIFVIPARHGAAANAFVSGVLNQRRYLFLTEPLLDHFSPDEVDAVVAHEIGHLMHRHVARMGMALLGTAVLVAVALLASARIALAQAPPAVTRPVFGVIGFLTVLSSLLVMRRLARRFEYEADDFSARTIGSGQPLARALRKLAKDNWLVDDELRSGSFASHPAIRERIQRLVSG